LTLIRLRYLLIFISAKKFILVSNRCPISEYNERKALTKEDDILGQEQGLEKQDMSILSLMAKTLHNIDEKQADLPAMITVISLFTLMSIVNMAQDVAKGTGTGVSW
jgi:hypothetical protein